ncbi:MAG: putative ABC transporter permease [Candidatus Pelethousia sp.]|jgi:uncharacterized membrane protein|nr:putative ABC transporter permease [Candidatus Pelethousia sp.]
MDMIVVFQWFLWFMAYSFMGWVYESAICSVTQKRFINRGFLKGPICPVYGFGALACIFLLYQRTENVVVLFLAGMFLTCAVEYITAVLLEKLFDAKWWDYSNRRFNLNGRICLLGAVVFGILSVILIKIFHPKVVVLTAQAPEWLQIVLAGILFSLILWDLYTTVRHLLRLNSRLKDIQVAINEFLSKNVKRAGEVKDAILDRFEESEFYNERIKNLFSLNRIQNMRIFHAFPNLRSLKYHEALQKLKKFVLGEKYS